jgi:septal ring factor EnvC (AmiA/AmiB activator)
MTRVVVTLGLLLGACGSVPPVSVLTAPPASERKVSVQEEQEQLVKELRARIDKLAAHLADVQRRYGVLSEEHRRTEAALQESQSRASELQQKLDALRAIDRDTRRSSKR